MSRIVGVLSFSNPTRIDENKRALKRLELSSSWKTRTISKNHIQLGWTGWKEPTLYQTQQLLISLDGTIYNGSSFRKSQSDIELIANLYNQLGFEKMLQQLNGDFALALYDEQIKTLFLARDRIGIKPLYYLDQTDFFSFASQPQALLQFSNISNQVNPQFVALFAASHYRYFDNQRESSPYQAIKQLPAASYLSITPETKVIQTYWSLNDLPNSSDSVEQLAQHYCELLLDAVTIRFKKLVHPAFTLSGGMDSSSVLACAVKTSQQKQSALSTVYQDKTYDESAEIQSMLNTAVETWHTVDIGTPDVFSLIEDMVKLHNEPVATATWLSHYLLCQQAQLKGFDGIFGGLGGDELNAGEYEYFIFHFADLKRAGKEDQLKQEITQWSKYHDHPIYKKNQQVAEEALKRLVDFEQGKCLPDLKRMQRYYQVLNPDYFRLDSFSPIMPHPFTSFLKNRTFQDIFYETAPCCLRAEDRQTIAHNLDHFLPFFDYRLVEFMFQVPGDLKIQQGVTKHLLRMAMKNILPEETRTRIKKTGWNAPAHIWFTGEGLEKLQDLVHSQTFRQRGIYNLEHVEQIIKEHKRIVTEGLAQDNHMMFLWQLVNLELWLQQL